MSLQTPERIYDKIKAKLDKKVRNANDLKHALLLVHSDRKDLHWTFSAGTTGEDNAPIDPNQPYHIASIGKTFTSVLIARLVENRLVGYDDLIADHLDPDRLDGLFVYRGTDYRDRVRIRHLLNHTSGIADYFDDPPLTGPSIQNLLLDEPQRFWTADETIDYTRDNQKAVAPPGQRFHYSDTGYNLLGKLVEAVTHKALHENLHSEIFDPLGMSDSYFLFYSTPKNPHPLAMADVFMGDHEISSYNSVSIDWAGGGIVSTTRDLLLFQQALVSHTLISKETFARCSRDTGRFGFGMDYGYGLLFINVSKMTVVLPKSLNCWGNFGSVGTYMFYNPAHDLYIIGSFNQSNYRVKQVSFIIDVMRQVSKLY